MTNKNILLLLLLALLLGAASGINATLLVQRLRNAPETTITTRVDTLVIRDTVRVPEPHFLTSYVIRHDTLRVATIERDTVLVELPVEQKVYSDSTYTAWVSGIRPELDSIEVRAKHYSIVTTHKIIETRKVPSRWGIGVQAGYGAGREGLSPYIGVGVSWNVFSW